MDIDRREPGLQDASVSDFLLPYLIGKLPFARAAGASAPVAKAAPMAEDAYGTELREGLMKSMAEPAKGYAMGGVVMPDMGDIDIPPAGFDVANNSTTMKTAGNIPPPPVNPAIAQAMAQQAAQSVPHATNPAPAAPPPQMGSTPPPMPGLADILAGAQGAGASLYGQYTPERRNELYAALLQKQGGMGNAIGSGLASVGDAIARGYGHDQTNFLDKTQAMNQDMTKQGLEAFDTTQKGKLAETASGLELQKMDPKTPISKATVAAYAPILINKLHFSPQQVSNMSAAQVESVAKIGAEYGGKEMENLFHQAQLIVESQFKGAEIAEKNAQRQFESTAKSADHPVLNMLPQSLQPAPLRALNERAGIAGGSSSVQPMFAKNSQGHRIMSVDGGHQWVEAK